MKKGLTLAAVILLATIAAALSYLAYAKAEERAEARREAEALAHAAALAKQAQAVEEAIATVDFCRRDIESCEQSIERSRKRIADLEKDSDFYRKELDGLVADTARQAIAENEKMIAAEKANIERELASIPKFEEKMERQKKHLAAEMAALEALQGETK